LSFHVSETVEAKVLRWANLIACGEFQGQRQADQ